MHIPTVCLLSSSSCHPVSIHHEPLLRCLKSTPQNRSKKKYNPPIPLHVRHTGQSCQHRGISLVSCSFRDALCHIFGKQTQEGGRRRGRKGSCLGVLSKIWFLIKSRAEWQKHLSFCAVVVVSLVREDQMKKYREKSEKEKVEEKQITITQRTS